jgi:hypothetical protein
MPCWWCLGGVSEPSPSSTTPRFAVSDRGWARCTVRQRQSLTRLCPRRWCSRTFLATGFRSSVSVAAPSLGSADVEKRPELPPADKSARHVPVGVRRTRSDAWRQRPRQRERMCHMPPHPHRMKPCRAQQPTGAAPWLAPHTHTQASSVARKPDPAHPRIWQRFLKREIGA